MSDSLDSSEEYISQDEEQGLRAPPPPEPWLAGYQARTFKGLLNDEFAWAVAKDRIARLVAQKQSDPTVPTTQVELKAVVKRIFDAIFNMRNIEDKPCKNGKICQAGEKLMGNFYPDEVVERLCWSILDKCRTATMSIPLVEEHHGARFEAEHTTFGDRMDNIVRTLRKSKAACKQLLDPDYIDRIVDAPKQELNAKRMNKKINAKRDEQNSKGREALAAEVQSSDAVDGGEVHASQNQTTRTPAHKVQTPATISTNKRRRLRHTTVDGEEDETPVKKIHRGGKRENEVNERDKPRTSARKPRHGKSAHKNPRPATAHAAHEHEVPEEAPSADPNQPLTSAQSNFGAPHRSGGNGFSFERPMPSSMNSHPGNLVHAQQMNSGDRVGPNPLYNGSSLGVRSSNIDDDFESFPYTHQTSQFVPHYPPLAGFSDGTYNRNMVGVPVQLNNHSNHARSVPSYNNNDYQHPVMSTTGHIGYMAMDQRGQLWPVGTYEYGQLPNQQPQVSESPEVFIQEQSVVEEEFPWSFGGEEHGNDEALD